MAVQWLGWRPDITPQYMQAETARRSLDAEKDTFRRALQQDAWEREFRERQLTQDWAKALLSDVRQRELGKLYERGRGERGREAQKRLLSANEKLQFRMWWKDAPEEARRAVLDDPKGRKVVEESLGFIPPEERYEKPVKPPKMTSSELKRIEEDIRKGVKEGEGWWDWIKPGLSRKQKEEIEEKVSPYREAFRGQWPGVGVGEAIKAKEKSEKDYKIGDKVGKGGREYEVFRIDAEGKPRFREVK